MSSPEIKGKVVVHVNDRLIGLTVSLRASLTIVTHLSHLSLQGTYD
jgi:hypothetical protein